jgi:hypothetical protein
MRSPIRPMLGLLLAFSPLLAAAQGPGGDGPMPRAGGPGGPSGGFASMLLAGVADLKLTDAQVTRLAAIARRTAEQRRPMQTRMDSLRRVMREPGNDSARRDAMMRRGEAARTLMEQVATQERAARRDALAVLTTDQVAQLFEMRERRMAGAPMGGNGQRRMMRRGAQGRGQGMAPRERQPGPGRDGDEPRDGDRRPPRRPPA